MNWQGIVAEFFGTLVLVLSVLLSSGHPVVIGITLAILVFLAAPYSGANLNPAIALASASKGRITWTLMAYYILAELLGGMAAWGVSIGISKL